jgi:hypothetical protein
MFIPDPDFFHLESNDNKNFFEAINFTKLKIVLILNRYRKKIEPIDKKSKYFFTTRIRDSRPEKTYPGSGSRGQKSTPYHGS